ncbi:MAG: SAM-dependent methyltransferase, partial [Betaproteobacteria bacterium]|nr:SAM-dependent methyltransferase [Betaproteobacteria bacterium]
PASLFDRLVWCDALPTNFRGAVLANEVLDVVPIHLLLRNNDVWQERGVIWGGEAFAWEDRACEDAALIAQAQQIEKTCFSGEIPEGYLVELCPQACALVASVGAAMAEGTMLWIDYGFRASEFYHPSRHMGTLMCHYRHYAHPDPFFHPGLQDITAHVDFSAIARAGDEAGLILAGYTTQAQFLIAAGLAELLPREAAPDAHMRMAQDIQRLTSPAEMGELFKVIGFTKGGAQIPTFIKARPLPL